MDGSRDPVPVSCLEIAFVKRSSLIDFSDTFSALGQLDFSQIQVPGASNQMASPISVRPEDDPETVRKLFMQNPDQLALLKQNNPSLADAFMTGNLGKNQHCS